MGGSSGCLWWAGLTGTNAAAGMSGYNNDMDANFGMYGVTLTGTWTSMHKQAAAKGVQAVANKLATKFGGSAVNAFRNAYSGGINITFGPGPAGGANHPNAGKGCNGVDGGGCTTSPTQIDFWTMAGDSDSYGNELTRDIYNVVHELGHAYDYGHGYPSLAIPEDFAKLRDQFLRPNAIDSSTLNKDYLNIQQHPSPADAVGEAYADMFVAWTFDAWNTDPLNVNYVSQAQGYMP